MSVQVITNPIALPACCMLCKGGQHNREWFLDFGVNGHDDRYGALILCNDCLTFIAHMTGFLIPQEAVRIRHENELLHAANELLNDRVANLVKAIETMQEAGFVGNFNSDSSITSNSSGTDSFVPETLERESGESEAEGTGLEGRTEGDAESSNDETVGKLRSSRVKPIT